MSADESVVTGEVVAVREAAPYELPVTLAELAGVERTVRYISFNPKTDDGRALMDKCRVAPDDRVLKRANLPFKLRDVYMHRVTLANKDTGEVFPATRTCLITTDGEVLACCSRGVVDGVLAMIDGHGMPPWPTGIPVKVLLQPLSNGHQWLTLVNDVPEHTQRRRASRP